MKKKTEGYILLAGGLLLFLAFILSFSNNLDYFITREYTAGTIISRNESAKKNGIILSIEYFNSNKDRLDRFKIKVPYYMDKKNNLTDINIIYTKWFNQHKIKDIKTHIWAFSSLIFFGLVSLQ